MIFDIWPLDSFGPSAVHHLEMTIWFQRASELVCYYVCTLGMDFTVLWVYVDMLATPSPHVSQESSISPATTHNSLTTHYNRTSASSAPPKTPCQPSRSWLFMHVVSITHTKPLW